jgi:hypothetical protein
MLVAGRVKKEHYNENKEDILLKNKERYQNNKEMYLAKSKRYQEEHNELCKEIKKKSAEKHKDENIIRKKEWYENNKERTLQTSKEILKCECGCEIVRGALRVHLKTKKHLDLLNKQFTLQSI